MALPLIKFNNKDNGQVLVIAIGLLAVASITFFLVFNSGRAVNEKINLVNAADAAAYSGAQIAARHLNFMSYTNRAMIANEVAIGHTLSFQVEADVVSDLIIACLEDPGACGFSPLMTWLINNINTYAPALLAWIPETIDAFSSGSKVLSGMLMLMYDANNAKFSNFQQQAYIDLVALNESSNLSLVGEAMQAVANTYAVMDTSPISVNNQMELPNFRNSEDGSVADAARRAENYNQSLCQMILFAQPSGALGEMTSEDTSLACDAIVSGGSSALPEADEDGAMMIDAVRQTVSGMENGTWIQDRNHNYTINGIQASRSGQTDLEFANGRLHWNVGGDSLTVDETSISKASDVDAMIGEARQIFNDLGLNALDTFGACSGGLTEDGQSCQQLFSQSYSSIQRYAVLNDSNRTAIVPAFLSQSNCSDNIGYDDDTGNKIEGWKDNLNTFDESAPFCDETIYAIGQARIFYQRPDCYGGSSGCAQSAIGFESLSGERERANLFNPFWQVQLIPSGVSNEG